jgi:hypothetical protein
MNAAAIHRRVRRSQTARRAGEYTTIRLGACICR